MAAVTASDEVPAQWGAIHTAAPQLAETMVAYVAQIGVSMRPSTARAVDTDLRIFAGFLLDHDQALAAVADIERSHIEAFKLWQWAQPGTSGRLKPATFRRRLGQLRTFFLRIIEWGWEDAPARIPIFFGDVPKRDEPLPRFLDDGRFTKFMRALADEPVVRRRVAVEVLARTGMRVGELCGLEADAVTLIGDAYWLRVPLGKLHNDRYVPLHPHLVELLELYRATYGAHNHGRLLSGEQGVLNRYAVQRWIIAVALRAGIGHVHPHQLRHTLATHAVNRGMSIEAIAALLGHRSLDMTLRYARISNRVVADEYDAVSARVEALYRASAPFSDIEFTAVVWAGGRLAAWRSDRIFEYDPGSDKWFQPVRSPLSPRSGVSLAWSGTEVLVWGGMSLRAADHRGMVAFYSDGAAYRPVAGR